MRPDRPTDLDALWSAYQASTDQASTDQAGADQAGRDQSIRDQLIVHYAPLVKFVAGRLASGLPHHVEQADLVSYGIIGLIDAIEKFDPGRGFKFETYAISRIRGSMLDELRSIDWVPRSVRAKAKALEQAFGALEAQLHRAPTDAELAAHLDWSDEEVQSALGQISFTGLVALDELLGGSERATATTLGDTLADSGMGPLAAYEVTELREHLASAIRQLGEREQLVIGLYYYEGLTLGEIGTIIGVTESRVCQIHTKAVLRLRARLAAASA